MARQRAGRWRWRGPSGGGRWDCGGLYAERNGSWELDRRGGPGVQEVGVGVV